jgi:hypothetical protein
VRIVNNNRVVLAVEDDYVIIMAKGKGPDAWDPTGSVWGLAQGFKVVRDTFSKTLVLVPLGEPSRIRFDEFKPEDLETE